MNILQVQRSKLLCLKTRRIGDILKTFHKIANLTHKTFPSKKVRQLFLDYFINEKNHTYVHSSSVFLNNDPTLLFVNAGMNQFRSLLLDKLPPNHSFSKLKRAANSQKCVRLSGKHNDLDDVGQDLHHHTFFEMLGNWSFGDYSKRKACEMAWELLTKVYCLNPENLYVTYFGGSRVLGISADEECRSIWLDIGVHPSHIFPFEKENFWEMGDVGPCGPCTEIHFDFLSSGPESAMKRINADKPDLIEIWNLVFIQYNRERNGSLTSLPLLNVDTGMGLERLTAILQGTMSNYDTDIFMPLFKAIEKNFNIRPYEGKTGIDDLNVIDTAYRVIADHSRMFSVSIADGLFPDNFDAGHVLRKIIRRASYAANRVMKSRPGVLSTLVPVVAESLDFFPEISKNVKEIVEIVNEEEKLFHQLVNRGRKARNKMMSDNGSNVLNGQQVYHLRESYGLEEAVLKDIASEVNLTLDWKDYQEVKKKKIHENNLKKKEDTLSKIARKLQDNGIHITNDSFKYDYVISQNKFSIPSISAVIVGIATDPNNIGNAADLVNEVKEGNECFIITDKTNFYSEAGGQIADIGKIYNDDFTFEVVSGVLSSKGYVFHKGTIAKGTVRNGSVVKMLVDEDHRLACTQNHTATHLLNSALRDLLPFTSQRSSYVGPTNLRLGFSSKAPLTFEQIEELQRNINEIINKKIEVTRFELPFLELIDNPKAVVLQGEEYPETVTVVSIGSEGEIISLEPCCGTHVHNTSDIEEFIIIPSKSHGGSTRVLNAVTGRQAVIIQKKGQEILNEALSFKKKVDDISVVSCESVSQLLEEIKRLIKECQLIQNAPFITLKKSEKILQDEKLKLSDLLSSLTADGNTTVGACSEAENLDSRASDKIIQSLLSKNLPITKDDFKYEWTKNGVKPIVGKILSVIHDNELVCSVTRGLNCQLILDKTNFYAEDDDQACDIGTISSEDFVFKVSNVYKANGFVFHDGYVEDGNVCEGKNVKAIVNKEHRLASSQNHTVLHLLNAVLKEELPYSYQLFAHAGAKDLVLIFSSKASLTDEHLQNIERKINEIIKDNLEVLRSQSPTELLNNFPAYKLSTVKKSEDFVPIISIGRSESKIWKSVEPCYGTHVNSTANIGHFIITSSKSKNRQEKSLRAVTGNQALIVRKDGEEYERTMLELEEHAKSCLAKENWDFLELWDCLKDIKVAKGYHETELPLLLFREHQNILSELSRKLTAATDNFVQEGFKKVASEMKNVLNVNSNKPYIIYNLESIGDGKKIINYAIENSQSKPAMYFAKDGHKSVICTCYVPKHLVHSKFSALLWINPVASFLGGKARSLTKDPEILYSVVCSKTDNLVEAINIATCFIDSNLIRDNS